MSELPNRDAPVDHPIARLLRQRRSPRSVTGARVPEAALASLLESAEFGFFGGWQG